MAYFISKRVFPKLKKELDELKLKRKEIAECLQRTAAFGDLTENAEFWQAREEKERLERRIFEIEQKLKNIKIKDAKASDGISLYSKVKLKNKNKIFKIILVLPEEIDTKRGRAISVESPLGRTLLERKREETIEVQTPLGKETFKILQVENK